MALKKFSLYSSANEKIKKPGHIFLKSQVLWKTEYILFWILLLWLIVIMTQVSNNHQLNSKNKQDNKSSWNAYFIVDWLKFITLQVLKHWNASQEPC